MYSLLRSLPVQRLLLEQAPVALVSLLTTELFFKLHSFTLECLVFLSMWYLLDAIVSLITRRKS